LTYSNDNITYFVILFPAAASFLKTSNIHNLFHTYFCHIIPSIVTNKPFSIQQPFSELHSFWQDKLYFLKCCCTIFSEILRVQWASFVKGYAHPFLGLHSQHITITT
jgi:hypothetical protein